MRTVGIIQARLGSRRLPGKVLMGLRDKPVIAHVIERAQAVKGLDDVVLDVPAEDVIAFEGINRCPVHGVKGQQQDVLGSYLEVANRVRAEVIVRLTGDCPLLATDLVEQAIQEWHTIPDRHQSTSYVACCMPYTPVADGWDVEIFPRALLERAVAEAPPTEREHVTTWMRTHASVYCVPMIEDWTALKCSVDTSIDLERVRKVCSLIPQCDFGYRATWRAWELAGRP